MKDKKSRVLYVVSSLRPSGPTNQLKGIISNLDKSRFDASILTLSPEPINTQINDFISSGIEVDSLNLSRVNFVFQGRHQISEYLKKIKPDIIHTSGVRADSVISKLNTSGKHCMTIRNFAHDDYIAKFGSVVGKFLAKSNIKAMNRCDYVVCCSKTLKNMYKEILIKEPYVVQNGVDTNKFFPATDETIKSSLRAKLGLPKDKIIFIAVGSLIKRKDPITMIRAFMKSKVQDRAVLVLLGNGDLMDLCKKEADESIMLIGNVDNVQDYLMASDVYVSASVSEGLPNSVLEAGRCGVNLILSEIPQHREVFVNFSKHVSFFKTGNENELMKLYSDEVSNFSNTINYDLSKYFEVTFSNEAMSKKYQKIYDTMIEK